MEAGAELPGAASGRGVYPAWEQGADWAGTVCTGWGCSAVSDAHVGYGWSLAGFLDPAGKEAADG